MHYILKNLVLPGVILLALDYVYLNATKPMFESQIIEIQRVAMNVKIPGAVACYAFLIFGLYYFILRNHRPILDAVLLGLVIYGVYETTSYALLKKWRPSIMIMDTLWGGALFGLTTAITYML
jgi:uncharacterized membrane protein